MSSVRLVAMLANYTRRITDFILRCPLVAVYVDPLSHWLSSRM